MLYMYLAERTCQCAARDTCADASLHSALLLLLLAVAVLLFFYMHQRSMSSPPRPAIGRVYHDAAVVLPFWSALPADLQLMIVAKLPLEDRLATASTCREAMSFCAAGLLWREIKFAHEHGGKVTDASLLALLERWHAHRHTRRISLRGCTRVRGHGLEPLRASTALEWIDLRLDMSNGPLGGHRGGHMIDPLRVVPILKSMLPFTAAEDGGYRLREILVPTQRARGLPLAMAASATVPASVERHEYDQPWRGLMRWLDTARERWPSQPCTHCGRACSSSSSDSFSAHQLTCARCGSVSCGAPAVSVASRADACPRTFVCWPCGRALCTACETQAEPCTRCGETSCSACNVVRPCDVCGLVLCAEAEGCFGLRGCESCKLNVCAVCAVDATPGLRACSVCNRTFCGRSSMGCALIGCPTRSGLGCADWYRCDACAADDPRWCPSC